MELPVVTASSPDAGSSRFELAPPRHFLRPAILLLLLEAPGHGYSLVKELHGLRLGRVDRPRVYRTLAQLEADGLIDSAPDAATAGQARRVYELTPQGERALRAWMGVIKEERDGLDRVLRRYAATGSIDAVLAGVEGCWASVTGPGMSPVSATSEIDGRRVATTNGTHQFRTVPTRLDDDAPTTRRFEVIGERSAVLIEARSTVGPITFGTVGITGSVETTVQGGEICVAPKAGAHLQIDLSDLTSGNALYDAELRRRIDARRFPLVDLNLRRCQAVGVTGRLRLGGEVTFHGVTRALEGTVSVSLSPAGRLVVTGEEVFDIRDYDIASPTVLMLRIYPDVVVRLHVEAEVVA